MVCTYAVLCKKLLMMVNVLPSTVDSKLLCCFPSALVHCCFVSLALHDDREGWERGPGALVDIGVPGASHPVAQLAACHRGLSQPKGPLRVRVAGQFPLVHSGVPDLEVAASGSPVPPQPSSESADRWPQTDPLRKLTNRACSISCFHFHNLYPPLLLSAKQTYTAVRTKPS